MISNGNNHDNDNNHNARLSRFGAGDGLLPRDTKKELAVSELRHSYPIPLPEKVLRTSSCTHLFYKVIIQTILGMGMGMNVTAQSGEGRAGQAGARRRRRAAEGQGVRGSLGENTLTNRIERTDEYTYIYIYTHTYI